MERRLAWPVQLLKAIDEVILVFVSVFFGSWSHWFLQSEVWSAESDLRVWILKSNAHLFAASALCVMLCTRDIH